MRGLSRSGYPGGSYETPVTHFLGLLRTGGCQLCGNHRAKFQYRDPATRQFNVQSAGARPLQEVLDEVQKCTYLCDSCQIKLVAGLFLGQPNLEIRDFDIEWGLRYVLTLVGPTAGQRYGLGPGATLMWKGREYYIDDYIQVRE
jgi:hypothetical protein